MKTDYTSKEQRLGKVKQEPNVLETALDYTAVVGVALVLLLGMYLV